MLSGGWVGERTGTALEKAHLRAFSNSVRNRSKIGLRALCAALTAAAMNIDMIPTGKNPPHELNVIIEVPSGGEPVKYEFDKKSGALFVDRILHTPMRYPANYGFVPHTLSPDGDPLDALVIARSPFIPGCVVRARPIAVLKLEDEAGGDEKLVCVPVDTTFPYYTDVGERHDLPSIVLQQIEHFFTHYKDLESEKWVRIGNWGDADEAREIVLTAIQAAKDAKDA
jgi:inorganic pyrophosphatase